MYTISNTVNSSFQCLYNTDQDRQSACFWKHYAASFQDCLWLTHLFNVCTACMHACNYGSLDCSFLHPLH